MLRTLVLDLDGTLVDSVDDLAASLNIVLAPRGFARTDRPEVTALIGSGARVLFTGILAARGLPFDELAFNAFLAHYTANAAVATRPYPGVTETLPVLAAAGWALAICTNKPEAPTRALLAALGLAPHFAAVGGGDSFPTRKPDPAHLLSTLEAAGGAVAGAIMVGDHANDVAAARGAGLPCVFAAWGYGPPTMAGGAAAIADTFADLPAICARLVPA